MGFFSLPFAFLHRQCWKLFDSAQLLFSGLRQHVENAKSQMGFITGSRVSFSFFLFFYVFIYLFYLKSTMAS